MKSLIYAAAISFPTTMHGFEVSPPYEMTVAAEYHGIAGACPYDMDVFSIYSGIRDRDAGKVDRLIAENECTILFDGSTVEVVEADFYMALVRITFSVQDNYYDPDTLYWMDMVDLTNWLDQPGREVYEGMKDAFGS